MFSGFALLGGLLRVAEMAHRACRQIGRRVGDHRAGAEDRGRARLVERGVIVGRDHAARPRPGCRGGPARQRGPQRRDEREVPGGERARADDVHVVLDRLPRRLLGRLEQRRRCRRRSRGRRTPRRSPSGRGRGRPGPSSRPGCAAAGPRARGSLDIARARSRPLVASRPPRHVHAGDGADLGAGGGPRPSPAPRRSRRPSPGRGPRRSASVEQVAARRARRARSARRARASTAAGSRSARSSLEPLDLALAHRRVVDLEHRRPAPRSRGGICSRRRSSAGRESMRACVRAAASSIRSFGTPASMAFTMPPSGSTSSMCARASPRARGSAARRSSCRPTDRSTRVGARLELEEELRVAGDARREVGRQRERLVERVRVQALRVALRRGHGLDAGADDVVVDVLRGERPPADVWQCVRSARLLGLFGLERLDELRPEQARRRASWRPP